MLVREGDLSSMLEKEAMRFIESSVREMESSENEEELGAGSRVTHKVFGTGTVITVDDSTHTIEIRFDNNGATKHLSASQLGKSLQKLD